jgi:hypothetical protein
MLATVGFDHKFEFDAGEIGDERADRVLTFELRANQATVTQRRPQSTFGVGHGLAEIACRGVSHR